MLVNITPYNGTLFSVLQPTISVLANCRIGDALANFAEARRIEELAARANAERQYAEQMSALATDPLVR